MGGFLSGFCCLGLPVLFLLTLRLWKPPYEPGQTMSIADRIAWTVFALGICLMVNITLYSMALESDGSFRSWDLIRFHVRVFLGISLIPVAGPLIVFLWQVAKRNADSTEWREWDDEFDELT